MDLSIMTKTTVVRTNRLDLTRKQLLQVLAASRAQGVENDAVVTVIHLDHPDRDLGEIGDDDVIRIEWDSKGKDDES